MINKIFDQKDRKDYGFSLLELVIAVGILLVLTVGGLLAYDGIIGNARQAAVNNAADTVYNRAMVYETDNKSETTYQTAVDDWNKASGILPDEAAVSNIVAGIGVNKEKIIVEGTELDNNAFEIKATYGDPDDDVKNKIQAVKRSIGTPVEGENGTDEGEGNINPDLPIYSPNPVNPKNMSVLSYTCSETTTGTLPFHGIHNGARIIVDRQGYPNPDYDKFDVTGSTAEVTIPADKYTHVTLYGSYDELNGSSAGFENCSLIVSEIGEEVGVKKITHLPDGITWAPQGWSSPNGSGSSTRSGDLPASVTNLDYLFDGSVSNVYSVWRWDTSNVTSMRGTFQNYTGQTDNETQVLDLTNWDVSNVSDYTDFDPGNGKIIAPNFN